MIDDYMQDIEKNIEKKKAAHQLALKNVMSFLQDPLNTELAFVKSDNRYWVYLPQTKDWQSITESALRVDTRIDSLQNFKVLKQVLNSLGRVFTRKTYSFRPQPPGEVLNLLKTDHWLKPAPPTANTRFFDYILYSLGNGKPENILHIKQVIGWKYLHPEEWQLPALCLFGQGRSGKNLLASTVMSHIFGHHQCLSTSFRKVEKFDSALVGKVIVLFDEQPRREDQSRLKEIIGNPILEVEAKGMDTFKADNTALYVIATNERVGPVRIEHNGTERRFSFIRSDISLREVIANGEGISIDEADALIKNYLDEKVFRNPSEVAGFLQGCIDAASALTAPPAALHGEDYHTVSTVQSDALDEVTEEVFNDPQFDFITLQTLYDLYVRRAKAQNPGAYPLSVQRFNSRVQEVLPRLFAHVSVTDKRLNVVRGSVPCKGSIYFNLTKHGATFDVKAPKEATDRYLSGAYLSESPRQAKMAALNFAFNQQNEGAH